MMSDVKPMTLREAMLTWATELEGAHNMVGKLLADEVRRRVALASDAGAKLLEESSALRAELNALEAKLADAVSIAREFDRRNEVNKAALHRISLASQNSMSSKEECGRIARETLKEEP